MKLVSAHSARKPRPAQDDYYGECTYTPVAAKKQHRTVHHKLLLSAALILVVGTVVSTTLGSYAMPNEPLPEVPPQPVPEVLDTVPAVPNTTPEPPTVTRYALSDVGGSRYSAKDLEQAADLVIDEIITGDMSQKRQVQRIYEWLRLDCSYSGHSDKHDVFQGAYDMLTLRSGDCYNYFAAAKVLFDRLGIQNIDVEKVPNYAGDSLHFWNLVSLDGGASWYHFDATPRYGEGANFCLVTDRFIDDYSNSHDGTHHRNMSLYPATPAA